MPASADPAREPTNHHSMTATTSLDPSAAPAHGRAAGYIAAAMDALPRMRRTDGVFCWERVLGDPEPRGRSLRYSLMVLLGLQRAQAAGYALSVDPAELLERLWQE